MTPADLLEPLVDLALEAGAAVMRVYEDPDARAALAKADGSPVTDADQQAEAIIVAGLARLAPGVPVVAEEAAAAGDVPLVGARFFLVDPLDGTREFLARNGEFTVNIGLVEHGAPTLGVVYAPALGELWTGVAEAGARAARVERHGAVAWRAIAVRTPSPEGLDLLASRSHLTPQTRAFAERFGVRSWVRAGSSLKFCRVAAGEADLYPRFGPTNQWDTCAGHAVLAAAGGEVWRIDGAPLSYGPRADGGFGNPDFLACGRFDPLANRQA